MSAKVSVILLNYNYSRYLDQSLGSLLKQRRPPDELIIIDDVSADDSVAKITRMIAGVPYARLVRNERNAGCNSNMNKGLAMATGDVILFAASDDVFYDRLIEVGTELLEQYPRAPLFSGVSNIIDAGGNKTGYLPFIAPRGGYVAPQMVLSQLERHDSWFMGNTTIYRRSALLAAGGFDEPLDSFADGFMCRLLSLQYGACYAPEVVGEWRRLPEGMASLGAERVAKDTSFADNVARKMAARSDVFTSRYIRRWKGRYIFGAILFTHAKNGASKGTLAKLFNLIYVLWMFVRLRPWDVPSLLTRPFIRTYSTCNTAEVASA